MANQEKCGQQPQQSDALPVRETKKPDFPCVPPNFNPLQVSPKDLQQYGLPPRPDPLTQQNLFAAWERIFAQPATFVPPAFAEEFLVVPPTPLPSSRSLIRSTRIEDSQNWSGALIIPSDGNQVVQIFGEWTVPTPDLPAFDDELGPAGKPNTYDCSTWIGLDGNRRYLNSTLPQVGTTQVLNVSAGNTATREYYAWFEWWAPHPVKILRKRLKNINITTGMRVMGMISVIDPQWVAVIFRTFAGVNSQISLCFECMLDVHFKGAIVKPNISGASAEWIMERPHTPGVDPTVFDLFPGYNSTRFTHCVAGTAPQPGVASSEEILTSPRLLRIYEVPPDPPSRIRLISVPRLLGTTTLEVDYGSSFR